MLIYPNFFYLSNKKKHPVNLGKITQQAYNKQTRLGGVITLGIGIAFLLANYYLNY